METIYLVIACVDWEGYGVVKAFEDSVQAEMFCKKVEEYESTREFAPNVDASDDEWDAYVQRNKKWLEAHPCPHHERADEYKVLPVCFVAADK